MKEPKYLREGDTVWITATARKMTLEEIKPAILLLKKWGYKVKIGKVIGLEDHQFAGTDRERSDDFNAAVRDPEVKAIWCVRGGYGTVRMVDHIDFELLKQHPKWLIGYSDITVLHSHLHNKGVASLHATMPVDLGTIKNKALASLKSVLSGEPTSYKIPFTNDNKLGECKGQLVGGNLSVLYSMLGSESSIDTNGKILFLEDLDEYLYHIDRMLMNLKRNGYFENLKGLVIGGMTKMHDNTIPFGKNATEIIIDITSEYNFPIAFNFPAGHIKDNRTLILGKEAILKVHKDFTFLDMNV
ncbi:LD-carboxypeptidase [Flavobacteriaceae bacterium R38]|nr:LD-carboxypeptidase [Flavobacteriaceae bacterium R38]